MKFSTIMQTVSVGALVAFGASAGLAQTAAAPAAAVVLKVNDNNPVGAAGDSALSLDEAIRLANGTLALGGLSAAERAQVTGTPGAASRDLIELPKTGLIMVPEKVELAQLVGNDGDTIEGNGTMLVSEKEAKGQGLTIASSNFTLRNLHTRGFLTAIMVDFGGRNLSNISLDTIRLTGLTFQSALLVIGASKSNGSLRGISVTDSMFDAGREAVQGNLIFIAAAKNPNPETGLSRTVDNVLLEDVKLVRNWFNGGGLGLYLNGSLGGGTTTNAVLRNAVLADNVFIGQHDAAANIIGGLPAAGGKHTKVVIENVVASGNRVETPNWGFYMGNELFGWQGLAGTMTDSVYRNITITKNIFTKNAKGSVGHCISFENSADFTGDEATNNLMENVKITDNDISGCVETPRGRGGKGVLTEGYGAGVYVNAGRAALGQGGGGTARNNVARNIEITGNRIKDSTRGIVVNAGYNRFPGKAPKLAVVTGNTLTGLRIENNRIQNSPTGIRVTGGDGAPGSTVTGNSMTGVTIRGNQVTGAKIACETIANAGTATGNTLVATCQAPRR